MPDTPPLAAALPLLLIENSLPSSRASHAEPLVAPPWQGEGLRQQGAGFANHLQLQMIRNCIRGAR